MLALAYIELTTQCMENNLTVNKKTRTALTNNTIFNFNTA